MSPDLQGSLLILYFEVLHGSRMLFKTKQVSMKVHFRTGKKIKTAKTWRCLFFRRTSSKMINSVLCEKGGIFIQKLKTNVLYTPHHVGIGRKKSSSDHSLQNKTQKEI